ncbi:MAG: hypothetical protein HYR91_10805 [Flavobacteriia bacterium]|nr:hypothetical protein [Flavobacteriia bacterium]
MDELNTSNNNLDNFEQENQRPKYLTVLCILSFVFIGLNIITTVASLFMSNISNPNNEANRAKFYEQMEGLRSQGLNYLADLNEQLMRMSQDVFNHFALVVVLKIVLLVLGFVAVFNMWKGKKLGFHIYIIYCLFEIGQMYFYTSPSNIPSVVIIYNVILSGIFVLMYSRNLKWLQ